MANTRKRRAVPRTFVRALGFVIGLIGLYEAMANLTLRSALARMNVSSIQIGFADAYTWFPGRVVLTKLQVADTGSTGWQLNADRAYLKLALGNLLKREIRVQKASLSGGHLIVDGADAAQQRPSELSRFSAASMTFALPAWLRTSPIHVHELLGSFQSVEWRDLTLAGDDIRLTLDEATVSSGHVTIKGARLSAPSGQLERERADAIPIQGQLQAKGVSIDLGYASPLRGDFEFQLQLLPKVDLPFHTRHAFGIRGHVVYPVGSDKPQGTIRFEGRRD